MADEPIAPVFELTPDMKKRLDNMGDELARAEKTISVLKEMGMDTRALEEKYEWSVNIRDILVKNFG